MPMFVMLSDNYYNCHNSKGFNTFRVSSILIYRCMHQQQTCLKQLTPLSVLAVNFFARSQDLCSPEKIDSRKQHKKWYSLIASSISFNLI